MGMKCEEEFNPWPAFVDIFSAVILVLLLFLLVTLVNIGFYAQFKFKIQYTGAVATDDIILQDSQVSPDFDKEVVVKDEPVKEKQEIVETINKDLQLATDLEQAGKDLSDVKKKDNPEALQKIKENEESFYISYKKDELFLDQPTTEALKSYIEKIKEKNPNAKFEIRASDPLNQISSTISKQITLARALSVRNLMKRFNLAKKDVRLLLNKKVNNIPDDLEIEMGLLSIEVVNE